MNLRDIGKWCFVVGILIALIAAFTADYIEPKTVLVVLLILGLIVGLLNITAQKMVEFLVGVIALVTLGLGSIQAISVLGITTSSYINAMLSNFIAFVGAAGVVVAIKAVLTTVEKPKGVEDLSKSIALEKKKRK